MTSAATIRGPLGVLGEARNVRMVLLKATDRCNLSCAYCHDATSDASDMALAVVEQAARHVCSTSAQRRLTFVFHGGEPSVLGAEWLSTAIERICKRAAEQQKIVAFGFQTNGVAVSDDMLEVLLAHDVRLSVSIDGPPALKGAPRSNSGTASAMIMRAQRKGLRVSTLTTINRANWFCFDAVFRWLEQLDLSRVKVNVLWETGRATPQDLPSSDQVFHAQRTIIDYLFRNRGRGLVEENRCREIVTLAQGDTHLGMSICGRWPCGAGQEIISVGPDGRVLPCGRFDHHSAYYDIAPERQQDCEQCSANRICSSGCRAFLRRSRANPECRPAQLRMAHYSSRWGDVEGLAERLAARTTATQAAGWDDYSDYSDYSDYQ